MSGAQEKLLTRIGALLAKAESTDSEHEAQALTAKAQELATLHAIDLAAARERTSRAHRRQVPVQHKIVVGVAREQGLRHRVNLFTAIGRVNDLRVDVARNSTYVIAFGFDGDIAVTEKLYASLVTQMVAAANGAIRRGEHRQEVYWSAAAQAYRSDARVFRSAFNHAFVSTISQRLHDARAAAIADDAARAGGVAGAGGGRGALVLARKADEVGAFYAAASTARGTYRGTRLDSVAWSQAGHASGAAAGRAARLGEASGLGGTRGELAQRPTQPGGP